MTDDLGDLDFIVNAYAKDVGHCHCREDIPTEKLTFEWEDSSSLEMKRAVGEQCEHCMGIRGEPEIIETVPWRR